jgi:hypothetical protein
MPVLEDKTPKTHARDCLNAAIHPRGDWCVCRFTSKQPGWPVRVSENNQPIGWAENAPIGFFSEAEAKKLEATHGIAVDRAIPMRMIEWIVKLYSHWDGSKVEMYKGRDYAAALSALGIAAMVAMQSIHMPQLKATLVSS